MVRVSNSITVRRPRQTVYEFWRAFENFPRFMAHLREVRRKTPQRSHWIARGSGGSDVEWEAEITSDSPGERLAWRSVEGSDVQHVGAVEFRDAPADRGTEITVDLSYDVPAGIAGLTVAKLFGEEPTQQIRDDLRRFKQVLETGEVVRSDGSPDGAGQGVTKQRAAQPQEMPEMAPQTVKVAR